MTTEDQMRKSGSYRFWKKEAEFIHSLFGHISPETMKAYLIHLYEIREQRSTYGSEKNSLYAKASLGLFMKDYEEVATMMVGETTLIMGPKGRA